MTLELTADQWRAILADHTAALRAQRDADVADLRARLRQSEGDLDEALARVADLEQGIAARDLTLRGITEVARVFVPATPVAEQSGAQTETTA